MRAFCVFLVAVVATAATADYFPEGSLGDTHAEHEFAAAWYSKHLAALSEPPLWKVSRQHPAVEEYRFLWLRTFHHPLSVRLTVASDSAGTLTYKETSGKGGYE